MYVGKGSRYRYYAHGKSWNKSSPHFNRKIAKMQAAGITVPFIIIDRFEDEMEAFNLERLLIQQIGRLDQGKGPLLNFTDGGEGSSGHTLSAESKEKIRKRRLGKHHTTETKMRISMIKKGKCLSVETIQKMKDARQRVILEGRHTHGTKKSAPWVLISPQGERYENIRFLAEYLKEHNMPYQRIRDTIETGIPVQNGRMKGWQLIKHEV